MKLNQENSWRVSLTFLYPDLKLDRLVIVCKFDGISSQRQGSEINMELKKKSLRIGAKV